MNRINFNLKSIAEKIRLAKPTDVFRRTGLFVGDRFHPDTKFVRIYTDTKSKIIPLMPVSLIGQVHKKITEQRIIIEHRNMSFLVGSMSYLPFLYDYYKYADSLVSIAHNNIWTFMLGNACMYYSVVCYNKIKGEEIQCTEWEKHFNEIKFENLCECSPLKNDMLYIYPYTMWTTLVGDSNQFLHTITDNHATDIAKNIGADIGSFMENASDIQSFHVYDLRLTNESYGGTDSSIRQIKRQKKIAACLSNGMVVVCSIGTIYLAACLRVGGFSLIM